MTRISSSKIITAKDLLYLLPRIKEKYISFTKHVDSTKIDKKNCIKLLL